MEEKLTGSFGCKEKVCIQTDKIYDSCRSKECIECMRVYLTETGQEILDRAVDVKCRKAEVIWVFSDVEKMPFNRGYYTVDLNFFFRISLDVYTGVSRPVTVEGVATYNKKVVLFGGEKHVNVFKSDNEDVDFCSHKEINNCGARLPKAVVEATDPIVLDVKVFDKSTIPSSCCCCCCDIPDRVMSQLEVPISDCNGENDRYLTVSIGIFSIIRLIRSTQLLINATEYCVPDKECITPCEENPCSVFSNMAFPTGEFCSHIPKEIAACSLKCK